MKFRMDKIIRELVEEAWAWDRLGRCWNSGDKNHVFSETLIDLESGGVSMRFIDDKGQICWKATPEYRDYLKDLRIDAEEELDQS